MELLFLLHKVEFPGYLESQGHFLNHLRGLHRGHQDAEWVALVTDTLGKS